MHNYVIGHGVENCKIVFNLHETNESRQDLSIEGIDEFGECLVQPDGKLFLVEDLKSIFINNSTAKIIFILDCCRDEKRNAGQHIVQTK